jgi:hypothetical protein
VGGQRNELRAESAKSRPSLKGGLGIDSRPRIKWAADSSAATSAEIPAAAAEIAK